MKKVLLQTTNYPGIGGIERSFEILNRLLVDKDYEVTIVALENSESLEDASIVRFSQTKYSYLKLDPLILYRAYKEFVVKNMELYEDSYLVVRSLIMSYTLHRLGIKHLFVPPAVSRDFYDGIISEIKDDLWLIKQLKILKRNLVKYISIYYEKKVLSDENIEIITFSDNVRKNLLKSNNIKREIKVIPAGIDIKYFNSLNIQEIAESRKKNGLNDEDFVILYVGRLSNGKNVNMLVEVFSNLNIKNKKLVLVGTGDYKFTSIESILSVGNKGIEELKYYYNIANCLVLPTTHEGFGQVLIESLGCGTPVIGFDTDTNAISEIIDDEIFGLKTSEISLSGLKKVLYDFHDKKDFFKERRLEIEEKAKAKFDWENLMNKIVENEK